MVQCHGASMGPGRSSKRILEAAQRLPEAGAVSGWASLRLAGANLCDGLGAGRSGCVAGSAGRATDRQLPAGPGCVRPRTQHSGVVIRHGVPCTTVARAVLDAVRWTGDEREGRRHHRHRLGRGAHDARAARGVRRPAGRAPGTARLRRALSMANDRSRSPNETRLRLIWRVDAGLPEPQCTWPVADLDGRRLGRPDLLSAALAVVGEFDGDDHSRARTRSIDAGKESAYATPVSRCSG